MNNQEPKSKKKLEYKIKIDKEVIFEALILDNSEVYDIHLKEIKKVFEVIMVKYYSKYNASREELLQRCYEVVFDRKAHYNQKFSAYNFVYTLFRNEVGNYIRKHFRDKVSLNTDKNIYDAQYFQHPPEEIPEDMLILRKYEPYLTGALDYTYIRIPRDSIINLANSLFKYNKASVTEAPPHIQTDVLFTLLKSIIR